MIRTSWLSGFKAAWKNRVNWQLTKEISEVRKRRRQAARQLIDLGQGRPELRASLGLRPRL